MGTGHRFLYDKYKANYVLKDPGSAGTILMHGKSGGIVPIVTAAPEARTLPAPEKLGQEVTVLLKTDVGDLTLTVTNGFNTDNDATMTFDDAGDYCTFVAMDDSGTLRWRVLGSYGVVGPTGDEVIDLDGLADGLVLDADGDTTISSPTDDQIDFEIGGSDLGTWTAADGLQVTGDVQSSYFDPENRVWARSEFGGKRLYTKAVASDWDSFKSVASADLDWFVTGSATAYGGGNSTDGGAYISASNSSSWAAIKPSTGSKFNKIAWSTSKELRMQVVFQTTAIAATRLYFGLNSDGVIDYFRSADNSSADSNRLEVVYPGSASDSTLKVFHAGGGSSSYAADTDTTIAAGTVYHLDMRLDASRIATVYLNGTLVYTATTALAATKTLVPLIGIQCEGAKKQLLLYHIIMSQKIA